MSSEQPSSIGQARGRAAVRSQSDSATIIMHRSAENDEQGESRMLEEDEVLGESPTSDNAEGELTRGRNLGGHGPAGNYGRNLGAPYNNGGGQYASGMSYGASMPQGHYPAPNAIHPGPRRRRGGRRGGGCVI